ncbi:MAG: glycosyltransferase family 4 protein [Thermoprotei archaeon]
MRVAILSDNPTVSTGYGNVARNLAVNLVALGHEVSVAGFQYAGAPIYIVAGIQMFEGGNPQSMSKYIVDVKPDVVLHIRDVWVFSRFFQAPYDLLPAARSVGARLYAYTPVQSKPLPRDLVEACRRRVDYIITMTRYGVGAYVEAGWPPDKVDYVYHAVDHTIYRPMDKAECKKYFGFPLDKPLVGYVGMNYDYRKMIPLAMAAFKEAADRLGGDAYMFIGSERASYWDLNTWIDTLGLKDKVFFPAFQGKTWGFTVEEMAKLYNAFDVLVLSSASEGFGIPPLEAQACGTPIIVTDTPVSREVYGDGALYAKSTPTYPTVWGSWEWIVDYKHMGELIYNVLTDNNLRGDIVNKAVANASKYTWRDVTQRLADIFERR